MDLAESFIQEKGFNGSSYAHIAKELNIKNAAIHCHFSHMDQCARVHPAMEEILLRS